LATKTKTREEPEQEQPYAMPVAPTMKKQLRLNGGAMTFNNDEEMRALEAFLGTGQVIDLTVQGTVTGAGVNNGVYTITFLVCDHVIDPDNVG
jgi:hypothetical protein